MLLLLSQYLMFQVLPEDLVSYQLLAEVKFVPDTEDITETVLRLVLLTVTLSGGEVHHQGALLTVTEVVVQRDVLYTVHSLMQIAKFICI